MQFKVPQNIQMEDKIIGPLTMKQFVYLLVGGMIAYTTIKTYNITMIIFVGVPVAILTLCLTFIKIQDQPFSKFLFSLAMYIVRPRQRMWQKNRPSVEFNKPIVRKKQVTKNKKAPAKSVEKSELEKLSYILDTKGREEALKGQKLADAPQISLGKIQNSKVKSYNHNLKPKIESQKSKLKMN